MTPINHKAPIPEASRPTEVARLGLTRLAPNTPLDRVFARSCELAAEAIGVERVGVWLFIDNHSVLRCANLYERSKREHSAGTLLRIADFPTYFKSLSVRKSIPAEVATTEPWTAELADSYLRPLGISSMLDAGIFLENQLVGVVCFEHVGPPREWTTEARDFAGSVADLVAMRIQSAQVSESQGAFLTQQDRLAAQDKMSALAQLAAGVAHDFKNLLTVMLGQGELIRNRADLPRDAREQGEAIVVAAERGVALARELMEFASPVVRPPLVLDLSDVTAEFLPVLQATVGARHPIRYSRPLLLGKVLIDKTQYTRLLLNLIINAHEAMPEGGTITLRLAPVKLTGPANFTGRFVLLEITDEGSGMDEETQHRVFEPFFTTKSKGTGLGLAIVRQIVERAGGLIRIHSELGHGTTFRLFFPSIGAATGGTMDFAVPEELRRSDGT